MDVENVDGAAIPPHRHRGSGRDSPLQRTTGGNRRGKHRGKTVDAQDRKRGLEQIIDLQHKQRRHQTQPDKGLRPNTANKIGA